MKSDELKNSRETCTACAGTMLLEFAALSRLSGEPIFEIKAHAAMDALWKIRHRGSDLMGEIFYIIFSIDFSSILLFSFILHRFSL